jgi:hypothetical protein
VERRDKEFEIAEAQIATGELVPVDLAQFAKERGLNFHIMRYRRI